MDNRLLSFLFVFHESSKDWIKQNRQQQRQEGKQQNLIKLFLFSALRFVFSITLVIFSFLVLYYALASPPMHLFYEVAPPAGPGTVYIPGGGFSGFWFHLGYLQSLPNIQEYDYYCFSSGCLGILAVLLDHTMEKVADVSFDAQAAWMGGNITRFEVIDHFVDGLTIDASDEQINKVLPKLKILITTTKDGFQVMEATNRSELKDLLAKTTWVPYITGWGFLSDEQDLYLDGGFSRLLHPACEYSLYLPMIWETVVHTFSPGLSADQVVGLWNAGANYDFGLPKGSEEVYNAGRGLQR